MMRAALTAAGVCLLAVAVHAQQIFPGLPEGFQPTEAVQRLGELETQLRENRNDETVAETVRREAEELRDQGVDCVAAITPRVEGLQGELDILGEPRENEAIEIWEQRLRVQEALSRSSAIKSNCDIVVLRSEQLILSAGKALSRLANQRLFSRGPNLTTDPRAAFDALARLPSVLAFQLRSFPTAGIPMGTLVSLVTVIAVVSVFLGLWLRRQFRAWYLVETDDDAHPALKHILLRPIAEGAPVLLCGLLVTIVLFLGDLAPSLQQAPLRAAIGILIYALGRILIAWSTNRMSPAASIPGLAPTHVGPLRNRMRLVLVILVFGFVILGPGWLNTPPGYSQLLAHTTLSVLLGTSLFLLLRYTRRVRGLRRKYVPLRLAAMAALLTALGAALAGYHNLGNYLLLGTLKSMLAAFLLWLLLWFSGSGVQALMSGQNRMAHRLRRLMGVGAGSDRSGLGIYAFFIDLALWVGFIVFIVDAWDLSGNFPEQLWVYFRDGFPIGEFQLAPLNIVFGILAFAAVMIGTGWARQAIQERYFRHTRMDRGAGEALQKLAGYLGFVIAVIIALNVIGVGLAGLALVFGALSFGIGFGLQNVVNHFVSGLVLLFERPIKSGDFVSVGPIEGTVRQISIRATEIETLDRQNVIVPNADLVSQQVTNWVLHDPFGRLVLDIPVAYGSDIDAVQEAMLEVANAHPEVLKDGVTAPQPKALFMSYGEHALMFELRVWIRRIQRRFDVTSDLNIGVDRAFRARGIETPLPQRELRMRRRDDDATVPGVSTAGDGAPAAAED